MLLERISICNLYLSKAGRKKTKPVGDRKINKTTPPLERGQLIGIENMVIDKYNL